MTSIIAFFILICVLVFVHEYGHFWAARRCGVKVVRFSIGFGKVLFKRKDKQGTEFAFSLIPLGGYVQMWNGEPDIQANADQSLAQKSILQRAFIMIAGPFANLLFAIVAYWIVFSSGLPTLKPVVGQVTPNSIASAAQLPAELQITQIAGENVQDWEEVTLALISKVGDENVPVQGHLIDESHLQQFSLDLSNWHIDSAKESPLRALGIRPKGGIVKPEIQQIAEDTPAQRVGLQAGDKILEVNQKPFDWQELATTARAGKLISLVVERNGQHYSFEIQPEKKGERYLLGIVPSYEPLADKYRTELKYDILTAFGKGVEKTFSLIKTVFAFIGNLLTGNLSLNNMGGAISMAKGAGATAETGWMYYLGFMALISVNLGVMNLFPMLPLDGGQLLMLGVEAVKGKPVSQRIQLRFQQVGMLLVLSLMAFALVNDVIHF